MPLLDKLKEKALEAVLDEDKHKEWLESGFDKAMEEGRKVLPQGDETEVKAVREAGEFALAKLEKNKGALVGLGQHGLRSTLTMLSLGQYDGAARHAALVSLRTNASWDSVSETIIDTAEAGNEAKRQLDEEIAAIKAALKDIGITAAKAVLPILLALI
jgi:hypothetical protein